MLLKAYRSLLRGPSESVIRGMLTLAMGTGSARVVGVITIPFLTRIYGPADYGVMAVFMSLVTMLVPFLTLRYAVAVPLPRADGIAINLMALCTLLTFSISAITAIALWAFGPWLLAKLSMEVLIPWHFLIVLAAIGAGTYEVLMTWATRKRMYKAIARTQLSQAVLGETFKITLGLIGLRTIGLLIGQVVSYSGGITSFLVQFRLDILRFCKQVSWKRIWLVVRYYHGFPTFRLASHVLMTASGQALILFSGAFFGSETTGQLGLATLVVALPLNVVGNNVALALYAEAAQLGRRSPLKIKELTMSTTKRLLILSVIPTVIIGLLGTQLFSLIFGIEWKVAGTFASTFAIYLMLQFASWPIIKVLNVFNDQGVFLEINFIRAGLLFAVFGATWSMGMKDIEMVMLYSVTLALYYLYVIFRIFNFLDKKIKSAQ